MEKIQHTHVEVRGVKLHVAEVGTGPKVVVFLHGFPEIWYSWRFQMIAVANAGYRAISIDFRGYGLSDHSAVPEKTTYMDLVQDVVALLDYFTINKALLVGKDFGALPVFILAALHPERVAGVVTLGIPFMVPGPSVVQMLDNLPNGFYVKRWQVPGRAEADFGRFDVKTVIRRIYTHFSGSELQVAADDQETLDLVDPSTPLPPWLTEKDLSVYASLYEKSGFRTALTVPYRTFGEECITTDPKINCPSLLIMGEKDYVLKFPGLEDFIRSGQVKNFMPNLEIIFSEEGNHFIQEQLPEQVNHLIITFLNKCST
ncbi:bifunctional epoxide hydrolase 2-like [Mangifera indica]|uniref:bifunctional epoxide hydrolase 2-like n=1 Tax=Mangifera indica TaxID=29780 RepID=UPI001CF9CA9E|nr:bifunctional epoxide hydrolase 2-like [Mangifera indica]